MSTYTELLDHINTLTIVDTHEHLPFEADRSPTADVLEEWLTHYFSCDLVSAGLSDEGLAAVRDSSQDLQGRWKIAEPYWHAARDTGYGRALTLSAQWLYGIDEITADTIGPLNEAFKAARKKGGHYDYVLKEKSRIAVSIRDAMPDPYCETADPFVFTMQMGEYISPTHYCQMRAAGEKVGVGVHTLNDWMDAARKKIETHLNGKTRVVCLKTPIAYSRNLRFDKVSHGDAELAFNEFFEDRNLPDWRAGTKAKKVLEDFMMHHVCRVADDHGLVHQIHTGTQEGNGNVISDSNPTLLTNLFLEYRNVKFDIFHMSYPYIMEIGNIAKNFRNVFIDMCWGHIVSPEVARRAMVEWLDAVPANKISAFGGDYCFIDGVYGHQLLARQNVAASLAQKVDDRTFSLARAKEVAQWVFVDNPKNLFGLGRFL